MPGFRYKLAQNLSSIFKMLIKHHNKMTAFPLSHVVQQKNMFSPLVLSHLAVNVLNFDRFISIAATAPATIKLSQLLQSLFSPSDPSV